jgi:hypothetical protein
MDMMLVKTENKSTEEGAGEPAHVFPLHEFHNQEV